MKKIALALAIILGLGVAINMAQDAAKPDKETKSVRYVGTPSMKTHKGLESHRIALAKYVSQYTVSVEIDYDREDVGSTQPSIPGIPGMGGPDMSDPFFRYDIGPFSGLVVGPNHILISDRCLGDFSEDGPSDAVQAITVTLPNGERWPARVLGRHQQIDMALLELDCVINETCPELDVLKFPNKRIELQRGEGVVVVGRGQNPLGTLVNDGIVSALERENNRAFQLDARIGNSTLGAPVVNTKGELVGMVTLHNHATFGQASGVSYAAYIDEVQDAYEAMKEGKFIARPPSPFMGIGANKKWPDKPGLEIGNVVPGSGAEKAGLRVNDIILQVEGEDMNELEDLLKVIGESKVGDTLEVKMLRGEEEKTVKVTLGPRP
ncbi:MAG: trypsin-like peptidase domain-containing protein [Planctomycetes bacterium]|nr:trypsin-like peptidase domain-containing protein [Planctomycetota bacterium]MCA8934866.1 trypsin-like peptidase domain-containing protein [Planctomycetota bacterium]